jgi:uncharacterized membrane protein
MKVIDSLLNIIEMYINEIKKKKILLNKETVKTISIIFLNIGTFGSATGSKKEKNKFKKYFDENNRLDILLNLFKYLTRQALSPMQRESTDKISITISQLFKNETPPLCYSCVLEYVNKLKSSPPPTSGLNFPSAANDSWNQIPNADKYIVDEDFSVDNGVLGFDRNVYLCLVKFLGSSTLRKV